jgi:hypothetical protein
LKIPERQTDAGCRSASSSADRVTNRKRETATQAHLLLTNESEKMSVFTHVTVGTNDLDKARGFYDDVLGKLGHKRIADLGDNGSIWGEDAPAFFVLKPADGAPASVGNGVTVSFEAPTRAAIDAFHGCLLLQPGLSQYEASPGRAGLIRSF